MTLDVEVQYAVDGAGLPEATELVRVARAAWRRPGDDASVVIRLVGADESRRLNADFRHKDSPTNVLSFPFDPPPGVDIGHLGDLVICAPVVEHEAQAQGKALAAHWAHMVVHGMLHLQGLDHQDDAEAEHMETLETGILGGLGFPAPYADDDVQ
jgi:probable rRNA maturation factor